MNRRRFLLSTSMATLGATPAALAAAASESPAIRRFVEAVGKVQTQWLQPKRSADPVRLAYQAISRSARPTIGIGGATGGLSQALKAEARQRGLADSVFAEQTLHRFMGSLDPWSAYLDPSTWSSYQASQSSSYCGVGMDIEKEENGTFTCWPYGGSPAHHAGIAQGAKLVAVNNRPISGSSIYAVGTMIRGREGEAVRLKVSGGLVSKEVSVRRARTRAITVFPYSGRGIPGFRISRFTSGTRDELLGYLRRRSEPQIEIDLRDCRGGDLDAAVACAGLFLEGQRVGLISSANRAVESLRAAPSPRVTKDVVLLQNGNTASSAELFIRALTFYRKGVSMGSRTKGKGTTQSIIPLSAGGALVLTTGVLCDVRGETWHGSGLSSMG